MSAETDEQPTLDEHQDDDAAEAEIVDETEATESPTHSPVGTVAEEPEPEPDTGTSVVHVPVSGPATVRFTEADIEAIRDTVGRDMSDAQLHLFLSHAQAVGLSPMSKQIYGWVDKGKLVTMVSIDGLRLVRDRTGKYAGPVGPQWCGADGVWQVDENGDALPWLSDEKPAAARFGVRHRDHSTITWGIATWAQYGRNSGLWTKGGGPHMLAKCAEAIASRMAFPQELGGLYTSDEIPEAVEISRPGGGSGKRRGDGANHRIPAQEIVHAPQADIDAAMELFNGLPDDGREAVEQRWTKFEQAHGWSGHMSIDDGALFEVAADYAVTFFETIRKAAAHYGTLPDDDGIVDAEIVEEDQ